MTLASEAATHVKNETLGIEAYFDTWDVARAEALRTARGYQKNIDYGLSLGASVHGQLSIEMANLLTQAQRLRSILADVKVSATALEMDNDTAGDDAVAALDTLLSALATAKLALAGVPALSFATYRDA